MSDQLPVKRIQLLHEVDRLTEQILSEGDRQAPNSNFRLQGWNTTIAKTYIGAMLLVLHREGIIKLNDKETT